MREKNFNKFCCSTFVCSIAISSAVLSTGVLADVEDAERWLSEFQPSTLSQEQQIEELTWFIEAARPFAGMEIKVVSETITTHEYEAQTLAQAFSEITGIQITHDLIGEGDVVEKLQTQMQSGENIYDAYVNDSDLIGTHFRYQQVRNLTDWMAGDGSDVTSPTLLISIGFATTGLLILRSSNSFAINMVMN